MARTWEFGDANLDGQCTCILINNSARMNTVMPAYVWAHLDIGPITKIQSVACGIPIHIVGGTHTGPMDYIIMKVQIEGIPSYEEGQVFLVVDKNSAYSRWVPEILGTPTINHIVMAMRELEMLTAPPKCQYSHHSYEFTNGFFMGMVGVEAEEGAVGFSTNTTVNPVNLNEKIKLKERFVVPVFGTLVLHGQTEQMIMLDHTLRVITQAPYTEDQANLPNGLHVLSTYTQLNPCSHSVAVVVWNGTSKAIHMAGGWKIGRVIVANAVPDPQASPDLLKKLDEEEPVTMLGTAECEEKLLEILENNRGFDSLKDWPPEAATNACQLLLEFHSVFSLQPNKMGCTEHNAACHWGHQ